MKLKKFLSAVAFACLSLTANAQMYLTPVVDATVGGLNENNVSLIENRMRTIISKAGCIGGYGSRFIMLMKVNLLERQFTNSAPVKICQNLEVSIAIGDSETGACFGSTSFEATGIGNTEEQAMTNAFKGINPNTPEYRKLVADAKAKMIAYYEQTGPSIIAHAKALQTGQAYEEAIYELSAIPQEVSCYKQACQLMTSIYQSNINHDAAQILAEAQAVWSADPNPGPAAEQAMSILSQINTDAKCYAQAQALMKKIETRVKNVTDAAVAHERNMEKARLNAEVSLEKARIKACRDVAVAYAQSRPRVVYKTRVYHHWW